VQKVKLNGAVDAMLDLRKFIEKAAGLDEIKTVNGLHWDKEVGAFTEMTYRAKPVNTPALLFDRIADYPEGYRCLYGMLASQRRFGLAAGLDIEANANRMDLLKAFRKKMVDIPPIAPRFVDSGPVLENVLSGDDVDVLKFPVPIHHELDGGRYIGTADAVITRDPDNGWINLGTYRVQVIDKDRVVCYITPGKHGRLQRDKYLKQGKPCPVLIVVGVVPILWLVARYKVPGNVGELDFAAGMAGQPIEVIKGEVTGLPIPATSEIVLEGEISPTDTVPEGPFGEWAGYYASSAREEPLIHIKRIYHRNNPILTCAASQRPPHAHLFERSFIRSAGLWDKLERADCPEIQGVWMHEAGSGRTFNVVSIKQKYYGHSRQAAILASQLSPAAYASRFTVVVDEDIDPSNLYDVIWAMGTRCDPQVDIEVNKKTWSSVIDPLVFGDILYNSRAQIDACKSYEHYHDFPPVAETTPEYKRVMLDKYRDLFREVIGDDIFGL